VSVHGAGTDWHWADGRCSLCGSVTPERAAELLRTPGTKYRGPSWEFGWPERISLNAEAFFAVHVLSLDDYEMSAFAALTESVFGIAWLRNESGLDYRARARGWCASGVIGETRTTEVLRRRA
jgi:hypothetical protein